MMHSPSPLGTLTYIPTTYVPVLMMHSPSPLGTLTYIPATYVPVLMMYSPLSFKDSYYYPHHLYPCNNDAFSLSSKDSHIHPSHLYPCINDVFSLSSKDSHIHPSHLCPCINDVFSLAPRDSHIHPPLLICNIAPPSDLTRRQVTRGQVEYPKCSRAPPPQWTVKYFVAPQSSQKKIMLIPFHLPPAIIVDNSLIAWQLFLYVFCLNLSKHQNVKKMYLQGFPNKATSKTIIITIITQKATESYNVRSAIVSWPWKVMGCSCNQHSLSISLYLYRLALVPQCTCMSITYNSMFITYNRAFKRDTRKRKYLKNKKIAPFYVEYILRPHSWFSCF